MKKPNESESKRINSTSPICRLTRGEHRVLLWVSEGKSNWEIAKILDCAEGTAKTHVRSILRKLGVENRTAAANCLNQIREPVSRPGKTARRDKPAGGCMNKQSKPPYHPIGPSR